MPTDCRGTLRRTVRSRNNRNATAALKDALPMAISAAFSSAAVVFSSARPLSGIAHLVRPEIGFVNVQLHLATRHRTLRMLAAVPYLLLPRSVLAAPSRRWTITGTRVEELDSLATIAAAVRSARGLACRCPPGQALVRARLHLGRAGLPGHASR
jgi:hypothetical protein